MKTKLLFLLVIASLFIASCKTSKDGCAGSRYQGERYKTTKFKWY